MRGRKLGELGIIKAPKWKFLKKEELSAAESEHDEEEVRVLGNLTVQKSS